MKFFETQIYGQNFRNYSPNFVSVVHREREKNHENRRFSSEIVFPDYASQ